MSLTMKRNTSAVNLALIVGFSAILASYDHNKSLIPYNFTLKIHINELQLITFFFFFWRNKEDKTVIVAMTTDLQHTYMFRVINVIFSFWLIFWDMC